IAGVSTGDNFAGGNGSENDADLFQSADLGFADLGDEVVDAPGTLITNASTGTSTNETDGSAAVTTGAGTATGNTTASGLTQQAGNTVGGSGPVTSNQQ